MGRYWFNTKTQRIEYDPGLGESFGGIFLGGLINLMLIIAKWGLVLAAVVIAVLMLGLIGRGILSSLGFLKNDVLVTVNSEISKTEISSILVSNEKKPKIYTAAFDEEGTAAFETPGDTYSVFCSYDNMMYDYGFTLSAGIYGDSAIEGTFIPTRAILIEFSDEAGESLTPGDFSITSTTAAGETAELGYIDVGGMYAFILHEDADGTLLTITVPGYEKVVLQENWEEQRLGKLEVRLNAQ